MNELVIKYKKSIKEIKILAKEHGICYKKRVQNRRALKDLKHNKSDPLRDEKIQKLNEQAVILSKETKSRREQLAAEQENIRKVERILYFLTVKPETHFQDDEVKTCSGKHLELLRVVYEDEFLRLSAFILENTNPKNKYGVVVVGTSGIRNFTVLQPLYSFGINISGNKDTFFWVRDTLKVFPSIVEAKTQADRLIQRCVKDFLTNYQLVKQECLMTQAKYTRDDFKALIFKECRLCGDFSTKYGADRRSNRFTRCCDVPTTTLRSA